MPLTHDQKLWLLTADPDTGELFEEAPAWLIAECVDLGIISGPNTTGHYVLTAVGQAERRALVGR